jgi:putative phosphoribosyl transferase
MFRNRTDAAEQLAEILDKHDVRADVVLAIPRGGLPVGRVIADRLGLPLDVVVARKIGAPGNEEFALGAVTADGAVWLDDSLIDRLGVGDDYLDATIRAERQRARDTADRYRDGGPTPDLSGKRVIIVDDGVATGATTVAALRAAREAGAAHVTLAVPVGPPDTFERLWSEADEVVCVECPPHFRAVGQFYRTFRQVSDDEAKACLDGHVVTSDSAAQ